MVGWAALPLDPDLIPQLRPHPVILISFVILTFTSLPELTLT